LWSAEGDRIARASYPPDTKKATLVHADAQVEVEKRRRGRYPKAWNDALALSAAERAARWRAIVAERLPTRR
jgi:hypothetical protein